MATPGYIDCPVCAEEIREKAKMCRFCGAVLTAEELPLIAPKADRGGSGPPGIYEAAEKHFEALGLDLSREHRQRLEKFLLGAEEQYRIASILFVDICGYTKMCEKLGGEYIKDILDDYYAVCMQTVDFYNGFVLEFEGDGCLAVFGAPVAFDRDAESAVRAALAIRDRIHALPPFHGQKIQVSAAVETGQILSSVIRTKTPAQYKVFGTAVNLAARIQSATPPNCVYIGADTYDLVRDVFELEKKAVRRFKNVEKPTTLYKVKGLKSSEILRRDFTIPFAGRRMELTRMEEAWNRGVAFDGAGKRAAALVISGEAGIGKTRLAREFAETHREVADTLFTDSAPYDVKIPWGLWRGLLMSMAGGTREDTTEEGRAALVGVLDKLRIRKDGRLTYMAILGDSDAVREASSLPHSNLRKQFCADLRDVLERMARAKTLLVVFDDLQWSDKTSLEILEEMISDPPKNVFFLLLHRDGFDLKEGGLGRVQVMRLRGLDEQSRHMLLGTLSNLHELLPELRENISQKAGGNPLYMMELVRMLETMREQARSLGKPTWPGFEELVPLSLKEVLQSRIDALDQRRKIVLQCGAVLGRRFALQIIELFNFIRDGLLGRLYSLRSIELLDDHVSAAGLEFSFHHHVTREVAYQSLLDRQRRELHKLVADQIEEKFPETLDENSSLLAYHYSQAAEHERAARYLQKSGERSAALAAMDEALDYFAQAIRRLDLARPGVENATRLVQVLRARGKMLRLVGDSKASIETLRQGLGNALKLKNAVELAQIRKELGLSLIQTGEYDEAEKHMTSALTLARKEQDVLLVGQTVNGLGLCYWGRGDFKAARELFTEVSGLAIDELDPTLSADARNNLALIEWKSGNLSAAADMFSKALYFRNKAGDKFGVAATLMNLGIAEENLGRFRSAQKHYMEALKLAEQIRYGQIISACHANIANLFLARDSYRDALVHSAKSLDAANRIGDRRSGAIALENLALAHLGLNQYDQSIKHIREGGKIARALGDMERNFSLELATIELMLAEGDSAAAVRRLEKALKQLNEYGFEAERPRFLRLRALASFQSKKIAEAREIAAQAISEAHRQGNKTEETRSKRQQALITA